MHPIQLADAPRRQWSPLCIAFLLLAVPLTGSADPLNAWEGRRMVEDAKVAMLRGDGARSDAITARIIEQVDLPKRVLVEAHLTRCAAMVGNGATGDPLSDCDAAEALGGRSWRVDGIRGMAYLSRGDADRAVEAFRAALRDDAKPRILRRGLRAALRARRASERAGPPLEPRLASLVR